MKKLLAGLLFITLSVSTAFAGDWSWSKEDVVREAAAAGITVIDWGQTRDIRNHNGMIELNPILGRTPSNSAINDYFTTVLILHPIVSALLPKDAEVLGFKLKPRTAWQWLYIGIEATATVSNYHGGLRLSF